MSPEPAPSQVGFAYDAFVSYSHADKQFAGRLTRRLRWYKPAKKLGFQRRRLRVFRDLEELTAAEDLPEEISRRLHDSEHLVVLCSPSAARSRWVNREVTAFLERRPSSNLLLVICAGEIEEALPQRVRSTGAEPLVIDLRNNRGLLGWRRFRAESLRLIARLLGVDYSVLAREDARRTRRRTIAAIATGSMATLGIGSALLIQSVAAESWEDVELPTDRKGSPILPVRDYAVNVTDPSVLLFRVYGAEYAANHPTRKTGIRSRAPEVLTNIRRAITAEVLRGRNAPGVALATFNFTVNESVGAQTRTWASGKMTVYGSVGRSNGSVVFSRALEVDGRPPAGPNRRLALPPIADTANADPFSLDPWPADTLTAAGLLPESGTLRGTIRTPLSPPNDRATSVEYELVDLMSEFQEGNDGMWFESAVVTNAETLSVEVGGDSARIEEVDTDPDLWDQVTSQPGWAIYHAPFVSHFSSFCASRDSVVTTRPAHLTGRRADTASTPVNLPMALLRGAITCDSEFTNELTIATRMSSGRRVSTLSAMIQQWHEVARRVVSARMLYWLNLGDQRGWIPVRLKTPATEGAEIIDIISLDESARTLLVVTTGQGIYRSMNGGATWSDFTLTNSKLVRGASLRIVDAGGYRGLYGLVENAAAARDTSENYLLRYTNLTRRERLRVGLAGLTGKLPTTPKTGGGETDRRGSTRRSPVSH